MNCSSLRSAFVLALLLGSVGCNETVPTLAGCQSTSDCTNEVCLDGLCRPNSCEDGRINGRETGIDCGGGFCPACPAGELCLEDFDCRSGVCTLNACAAPSCVDGVRNGAETGLDCGGTCRPCDAPMASCTDQVRNGSESDVDCGGSCPKCANGRLCAKNTDCTANACADGRCGGSACPMPLLVCGGACVDARVDRAHCGGCNAPCAGDCVNGQCLLVCGGGGLQCGQACVDPASNPQHCGMCGLACTAAQICFGGMCVSPCPQGQVACNGTCVSLERDPSNCGMCGRSCPANGACVQGQCTAGCSAPLTLCTSPPACVDARNDPAHCGGCFMGCPFPANAAPACFDGGCVLGACMPGFENCNGMPMDGCEAQLSNDPLHCGACNRACFGGESCLMGRCCGPLPMGSYQASCNGCEACNGILSCVCNDAAQNPTPTNIPIGACASGFFANCNGVLTCDTCP